MKIPLPTLFLLEFEIASSSSPPDQYSVRAIFKWVSKVIRDYIGCPFLCSVIGLGNSRHTLNQSDAKLKAIPIWSPTFSRALGWLVVRTLSSHWVLELFSFLLIGCCDSLVFLYDTQSKSVRYWWPVFLLLYSVRRTQNQSSKSSRNCGVKYNKVRVQNLSFNKSEKLGEIYLDSSGV